MNCLLNSLWLNHWNNWTNSPELNSRIKSSVMLRPTVSRLVYLGIKHPSGPYDQTFTTVRKLRVCWCGALSLKRGRVCLQNCCWSSPAQSFTGTSSVGLVTIFYCLRFEASFLVASYDSQGYGGGIRPKLWVWVLCYNRRSVGQSHWKKRPSGDYDQTFITVRHASLCGALSMTRGRVVVDNFCWASPAQSFPGPSPSRLPFSSPPTTRRVKVTSNQVKVKVILRPTVSRPFCLGISTHLGCCPLSRDDVSVVCQIHSQQ
jgi:hypothetical protein